MEENNKLKGLGGWLILVGIGVVLSPIRILAFCVSTYAPIFSDGTWGALTTPSSEAYTPYFGALLICEIVLNATFLVVSFYLIYLFFTKHYLFPKFFIAFIIFLLVFILLDTWIVNLIFPEESMFDPETAEEIGRILGAALIWIPYMLISKRVKATFVEKVSNKQSLPMAASIG